MDTSKQNIKMCEKAEEIQKHKWAIGDVYSFGAESGYCCPIPYAPQGSIWLPRQDQLQEMVFGISGDVQGQIWQIREFVTGNRATFPEVTSMEQLWLAFVMQVKYQKVWDAQIADWIIVKYEPAFGSSMG